MKKYIILFVSCLAVFSCSKEQPTPVPPVDPEVVPANANIILSAFNNATFNDLILPTITYSIESVGKEERGSNMGFIDNDTFSYKDLVCPCTLTYQFKYFKIDDVAVELDKDYDLSWSLTASAESSLEGKKIGSSVYDPSGSKKIKGRELDEYIAVLNAVQPKWTVSFDVSGNMTEKDETETSSSLIDVDVVGEYSKDVKASVTEERVFTLDQSVDMMIEMVKSYGVEGLDPTTIALAKVFINGLAEKKQQQFQKDLGLSSVDMKIRCVKFIYTTKDQAGNDIDLSSCMMWLFPESEGKAYPAGLNKLFLYCPYTLLKEDQCSTATNGGFANAFLLNDCLIVHPDYQGFGKTAGTPQIYLAHEITSRQMYDANCAAYKLFTSQFGQQLKDNWFTLIGGVSQGAGTSVATAKYFDTTSETWVSGKKVSFKGKYGDPSGCTVENLTTTGPVSDLWKLKFTTCACGPYSPSQTMMHYYDQGWSCYSAIFPVIVKSVLYCYPDIMGDINEERFYSDKYLADKKMWDDIFLNKTMGEREIQRLMHEKLADPSVAGASDYRILLSDIFSAEAMDVNSEITKKLRQCLERNDLTSGWNPVRPIYLTVAPNDQIVPYINSKMMLELNTEKIIKQAEEPLGNHDAGCVKWFLTNVSGTFDVLGN